jgi:hypothetical protein
LIEGYVVSPHPSCPIVPCVLSPHPFSTVGQKALARSLGEREFNHATALQLLAKRRDEDQASHFEEELKAVEVRGHNRHCACVGVGIGVEEEEVGALYQQPAGYWTRF